MPVLWIVVIIFAISVVGYLIGRKRALSMTDDGARGLHSLPSYYGWNVVMFAAVPSLLALAAWLLVAPLVIDGRVSALLPNETIPQVSTRGLVMEDVRRLASGIDAAISRGALTEDEAANIRTDFTNVRARLGEVGVALGSEPSQAVVNAAQRYRGLSAASGIWMTVVVLSLSAGGFGLAYSLTKAEFRARNTVERGILALLMLASTIAILTTLGIVLSMLFETTNFFRAYSWQEFFLGARWSPDFRGNSDLGILPLLWGTLYISLVALIVAVPIGLFAAIYMSEYAGPRLRSVAKPLLELLAGIPTIVYGLFALITVGPLIRDWLAQPTGWGESSSSVITAGLVMGIMLIPFVSSLSDDIINAVPQTMRDGSFGLGATKSETIRQVVVPAALPGIVGAVLLAASRAIGETMIVVMGAGAAAAQFQGGQFLNPLEAMTTVTVKIVSQLTGDTDFASPETLVAFALGLTLFVITLGLNVLALYIVRKYREQYE
ncbi:phosphate ABC transporter permease subunit PstC [Actibacterium sp. 188UL27-1]|uniref:phosphate ABC transporter permease subunit PstC n=1 Tax=Actibacterium sp. 188UL27-1 TaxID=2786961 RepID=UPI001956FEB7|nr:phosphate ABC transporter permease subunit PstC [Actibacterium sp. 188UL27-1]MBM7066784.1 phosphate ABC transporter permease subunit PstC [Actibacterium sp. 188UL27-1]